MGSFPHNYVHFCLQKSYFRIMLTFLMLSIVWLVNGELVGPVTITENGQKVTRYAVSTYAKLASTDGSSIIIQHDGQVQIAANKSDTYSADMFQEYKLKVIILS